MEAIAAGKNVLCEKAFTLNQKQAREIFNAAQSKNVYVAEVNVAAPSTAVHRVEATVQRGKSDWRCIPGD